MSRPYKRALDRSGGQSDWSRAVLRRDAYTCQLRLPGCLDSATQADHIVPLMDGGDSSLSNGRAVCAPCHNVKTQQEAARGRNRWRRPPLPHPADDPPL